jgi:hypothetical protein
VRPSTLLGSHGPPRPRLLQLTAHPQLGRLKNQLSPRALLQLPVTLQRSARGRISRDQARVVEKNMRHPAGRHSTKLRLRLDPATSGTWWWWGVGTGIMALHAPYLQTAATDLWTTNNKLDGPYVYRARVSCLSPPSRRACRPLRHSQFL